MTIQIHFTQTATQTKLHFIDFQKLDWCWQLEENFREVYHLRGKTSRLLVTERSRSTESGLEKVFVLTMNDS